MCTATWGVRYHLFLLVSVVRLLEDLIDRTQIHDRRGLFVRKREPTHPARPFSHVVYVLIAWEKHW